MDFSILHISDLHRDLQDEIANSWLLDSIEKDFAQFSIQSSPIIRPSLCIVSGDIVYGVKAGAKEPLIEIARQYKQAEEFLVGLADRFFSGDRNRVVILPGNHDVFTDAFLSSCQKIDTPSDSDQKLKLIRELSIPNSRLRWSWHELSFYRIIDEDLYLSRFDEFSKMYGRFYNSERVYAKLPSEQIEVFDFKDLNFSILALNSCYNNDLLNRSGEFHPSVIAKACHAALAADRAGWLVAASWHHNLAGSPTESAYVDAAFIQLLIDAGVSLSFHGHQHLSECFDERYRLGPAPRKMTVISAGTLCAEPKNLQPGEPRSYNVVEVLRDRSIGRVHQRRMINMLFNLPLWGPGYFTSTNSSSFEFEICPPLRERPKELNIDILLSAAENYIGQKKWIEALQLLMQHRTVPIARPFVLKVIGELDDPVLTISTLWPPETSGEIMMVADALLEGNDTAKISEFVELETVVQNSDASVTTILQRVRQRIRQ